MGSVQPVHWLIVIGVFVLLFGTSKLPEMARSLGRSARILRSELSDLRVDDAGGREHAQSRSPAGRSHVDEGVAEAGSAVPGGPAAVPLGAEADGERVIG